MPVYSVTQCSEQALQSMEIWTTALVVLSRIDSLAISAAALCSPGKSNSFSAAVLRGMTVNLLVCCSPAYSSISLLICRGSGH